MSEDLGSGIADPVIEVRQLRRRHGGQRSLGRSGSATQERASKAQQGFEAVRGVDLQVGRGELFALLGTNGAGKTSTVELLEGLAKPSGGSVRVLGRATRGWTGLSSGPRSGSCCRRPASREL
jgi:ABC-2 type transport system ATP-binding protein